MLTEFSTSKLITHRFHFNDKQKGADIGYDMIISQDIMTKIGLGSCFKRQVLTWEDSLVPMHSAYLVDTKPKISRAEIKQFMLQTEEPIATKEMTKRIVKI